LNVHIPTNIWRKHPLVTIGASSVRLRAQKLSTV